MMKRRVFAAVALLLFFSCLALLGAFNIHMLLSGERAACTLSPAIAAAGLALPKVKMFFFFGMALAALAVGYMVFGQSYIKYKSDMQWITPDIQTPKAEGQGQYGTARWLPSSEFERAFDVVTMDTTNLRIRSLIREGDMDLAEERKRE